MNENKGVFSKRHYLISAFGGAVTGIASLAVGVSAIAVSSAPLTAISSTLLCTSSAAILMKAAYGPERFKGLSFIGSSILTMGLFAASFSDAHQSQNMQQQNNDKSVPCFALSTTENTRHSSLCADKAMPAEKQKRQSYSI